MRRPRTLLFLALASWIGIYALSAGASAVALGTDVPFGA
jgi:hypothetical protein